MSAGNYGIALGIALVCGAIAVYLQRRFPQRVFASVLLSVTWSILLVVTFRLVTQRPAPYFWTEQGAGAEPWERLAFPLALAGLLWPALRVAAARSPALEIWLALAAGSLPLVAALPAGESYLDVLPGNASWSVAALLAIGANWLANARLVSAGAEHWTLWVFVAQLLTVAALLMTCYATLAEWSLLMALSLAVLATYRLFVGTGDWTGTLALPAILLSCNLLPQVRIYSGELFPPWLLSLPLLSPVIVCGVDRLVASELRPRYRIAIAAATAASLALVAIAFAATLADVEP